MLPPDESSPPWIDEVPARRERVVRLLDEGTPPEPVDFGPLAERVLRRRDEFLAFLADRPTPCYVFDVAGTRKALRRYRRTFDRHLPRHRPFYAVKSNPYSGLLREALRGGFGLDVSSDRELDRAERLGATSLLFSGPAKTEADLRRFAAGSGERIVMFDGFGELARAGRAAASLGKPLTAGVRVFTTVHGSWNKFGIPLAELGRFFTAADNTPGVNLNGIQVHLSWNRNPSPYIAVIREIAAALREHLSPERRARLKFIDLGGGCKPHALEAGFPHDNPLGSLYRTADEHFGQDTHFGLPYCRKESVPLEDYAAAMGNTFAEDLGTWFAGEIFTEPGRIVSTYAMHLALRVVDIKRADLAILDGGINMVGWEKYLHIHAPILNLTQPAVTEIPMKLAGSLCDPEDMWGERLHGAGLAEGDLLLMPHQGAYTFGTAQNFIRRIPPVLRLPPHKPA